ncbi:hypothetical protein KP509_15G038500 [Ceratopteris richardii]|uniref:Uncharacterized protein n=1 Tax=Ceratopteris richardii TaxID=49495 RepID=A0A8T2T4P1_CERRI|nr:hypothetical protein KP509_15G038500 [Ceratopteris richardii]
MHRQCVCERDLATAEVDSHRGGERKREKVTSQRQVCGE